MKTLRMAWRQLLRDMAAGDIRILFAALVLAVVAVTAVGFVTDRAERALAIEANRLLGGDAVVRGDAPITGAIRDAANAEGLRHAETLGLNSMIRAGEQLRLGDLRALGEGFPLRGAFRLIDRTGGAEHDARGIPASGTLWMTRAGADVLVAHMGLTTGGAIGADTALTLDDCVARVSAIAEAARKVRNDVIVLCHGGPIAMPADAQYVLDRCDIHGFYGASSMERLPTETAIAQQVAEFMQLSLRR